MARIYTRSIVGEESRTSDAEWGIDSSELALGVDAAWSIEKWTLKGGRQQGVELVEIDNGRLNLVVCPTRGMGIIEASCEDLFLGWDSPVREIVHPNYIDVLNRSGLGWLEGFNEWIVRCGLESMGAPGQDVMIDNRGNESSSFLPLHGRIANTPASSVTVSIELDKPHTIRVTAEVYETMMFGAALKLTTSVETEPDAKSFRIVDSVENLRSQPQEVELLYHCNYGEPLLGEGSELLVPFRRVSARDGRALDGLADWRRFGPPESGYAEKCYFVEPLADGRGRSVVGLVDPKGGRAASIEFSQASLPWFTLWKCQGDPRDGYVAGLEPGTGLPNLRSVERRRGRVPVLPPGGRLDTALTFGVHTTKGEVGKLRRRIDEIQGAAEPRVCSGPDPELTTA